MLIVLTWASLTFVNTSPAGVVLSASDTTRPQTRDTVESTASSALRTTVLLQERPYLRTNALINRLLESRNDQALRAALDSLLATNPAYRALLLKELLVPTGPGAPPMLISPTETFDRQMAKYCKFTVFERMGLIAKRYNLYYPPGKTLKDYQIDILGTIRWLNEVLQ